MTDGRTAQKRQAVWVAQHALGVETKNHDVADAACIWRWGVDHAALAAIAEAT